MGKSWFKLRFIYLWSRAVNVMLSAPVVLSDKSPAHTVTSQQNM